MATPKLKTSREERARAISDANVLPKVTDGRNIVIGSKGEFHAADATRCSCRDFTIAKNECMHLLKVRLMG